MKIYFAPIDGVTGFLYRNAHFDYFGGVDKYFAPFITPNQNQKLKGKEIRDLLPENNNPNMNLIPQLMGNNSENFIRGARQVAELGYKEININMGCPSGTVVSKKRGSGFLQDTEGMEEFFTDIFNGLDLKISVKTRIGLRIPEEFEEILAVYNKFPFEEIIVHPRTREQFYKEKPNMEAFDYAYANCKNKLSYNGDIYTLEDYKKIAEQYEIDSIMLGRGLLQNPNLANEIRGKEHITKEQFKEFYDRVYSDFLKEMQSDRHLINKMIEMWNYWSHLFSDSHKCKKLVRKANTILKYESAVNEIFSKYY